MKPHAGTFSVSDQLARVPSPVSAIVRAARETVRVVAPEAEELACETEKPRSPSMMWKLVRYVINGEVVVTIGTFTKHSSMFFARGSGLDDEHGLLEGTGENLRYITLRTPADAKRAAVTDVLRKAFALTRRSGDVRAPLAKRPRRGR
jgi:hypothetical protein